MEMKTVGKITNFAKEKPVALAIIGFAGVALFSIVDIGQILLYISVACAIIGIVIHDNKNKAKNKKGRK